MQPKYSDKVLDFLSRETVSEQFLIDNTFFYTELAQIIESPSQLVIKLKMQRKLNAPTFPKKKAVRKNAKAVKPEKPKRQHYSTKKLKLTSDDITYEERLKQIGWKPKTWTIKD